MWQQSVGWITSATSISSGDQPDLPVSHSRCALDAQRSTHLRGRWAPLPEHGCGFGPAALRRDLERAGRDPDRRLPGGVPCPGADSRRAGSPRRSRRDRRVGCGHSGGRPPGPSWYGIGTGQRFGTPLSSRTGSDPRGGSGGFDRSAGGRPRSAPDHSAWGLVGPGLHMDASRRPASAVPLKGLCLA
jgi:hypothetical protein